MSGRGGSRRTTTGSNGPQRTRGLREAMGLVAAASAVAALALGPPASASSSSPAAPSSTAAPAVTSVPTFYRDVPSWLMFHREIMWLTQRGITTGYGDRTYRPGSPVNRDAMAALLYRYAGSPTFTPPAVSPFRDLTPRTQFYREITWLHSRGITAGYPDGTFRPTEPVNRDATSAFLYRLSGSPAFAPPPVSPFTDLTTQTPFYREITWLAARAITTGYADGGFHPVAPVHRDAMAAFLYRFAGSPATTATSCPAAIVASMSASQRAGQLLMVGLAHGSSSTSLDGLITGYRLGGVILLGGWYDGAGTVKAVTSHLQSVPSAVTGLRLTIAVDQEGGAVQQLRGSGFSLMPSALSQGLGPDSVIAANALTVARQLAAVGVNANLAPVADTVPAALGTGNEPIGKWGRQYSSDPTRNARAVTAFVTGTHAGSVMTAVKHFPGLGRILRNTDLSSSGITDSVATIDDPYLAPFRAAIAGGTSAGTDMVMVGSAWYPRIDAANQAVFSPAIITGLLRQRLGWNGVVVSDDLGAAVSVSGVPVGSRAVRFIRAGGDVVLTARPSDIPTMSNAIVATMGIDSGFARLVARSAERALILKSVRGLAPCR